jgi:hypothetical protein
MIAIYNIIIPFLHNLINCLIKSNHMDNMSEKEARPESKATSRVGRYGNFYAYCGNTAVDLDPLPVSRARLTMVEPALFE